MSNRELNYSGVWHDCRCIRLCKLLFCATQICLLETMGSVGQSDNSGVVPKSRYSKTSLSFHFIIMCHHITAMQSAILIAVISFCPSVHLSFVTCVK